MRPRPWWRTRELEHEAGRPVRCGRPCTRMERTSGGWSAPSRATASATSCVRASGGRRSTKGASCAMPTLQATRSAAPRSGKGDAHRGDSGLQPGLACRRLHPLRGRQPRDGVDPHRLVPRRRGPAEGRGGLLDGLLGRVGIVVGVGRREDRAAGPGHPPRLPQAGPRIDEVVDREGRDHRVDGSRPQRQREGVGRDHRRAVGAHGREHAGRDVGRDRPAARGADRHASPRRCRRRGRAPGGPPAGWAIGPRARRPAGGRRARDRPATRHRCGSTPRRPTAAPQPSPPGCPAPPATRPPSRPAALAPRPPSPPGRRRPPATVAPAAVAPRRVATGRPALVPSFLFESPLVALAATIRDSNREGWLERPRRGDGEPQRVRSSGGRCSTSDRRVRLNV